MATWQTRRTSLRYAINALPHDHSVAANTDPGGVVTKVELLNWLCKTLDASGHVVEAYIQLICHHLNNKPRYHANYALYQDHAFYTQVVESDGLPAGLEAAFQMLRNSGYSLATFRQAQWFFVPMHYDHHSTLLVISPLNHTVEMLDCTIRGVHINDVVFVCILRWIRHELGPHWNQEAWRILADEAPQQLTGLKNRCGIFTCLYAASIARRTTLRPSSYNLVDFEEQRYLVAQELVDGNFNRSASRYHIGHLDRPATAPFVAPSPAVSEKVRSRTGNFDHLRTLEELNALCESTTMATPNGGVVKRYHGHNTWAPRLSVRDDDTVGGRVVPVTDRVENFIEQLELRELAIAEGRYP